MGVVKKREASREHRTRLGHHFISFSTRKSRTQFRVHEDLICATSGFFRSKLQHKRRPIEGECPFCYEQLDPEDNNIYFCRMDCGRNMHQDCVEEWVAKQGDRATCPICREKLKTEVPTGIALTQDLDSNAVDRYIHWLYTGELSIPVSLKWATEELNNFLVNAWQVSEAMEESGFRRALMNKYLDKHPGVYNGAVYSKNFLNSVYNVQKLDRRFRLFLVHVTLTCTSNKGDKTGDCFHWHTYPHSFLANLCHYLHGSAGKQMTVEDVRTKMESGAFDYRPPKEETNTDAT